jgi:hypothetical protein
MQRLNGNTAIMAAGARGTKARSIAAETCRLNFARLTKPLDFTGCPGLAKDVLTIARGWGGEFVDPLTGDAPLVTFARRRSRIHWMSEALDVPGLWRRRPPHSDFSALCGIHYEMSDWFLAENPEYLCLHSAAVRIGGSVMLLPADQKAGKSVLAMQFAAAGHKVFGDDVVAIVPRQQAAMSLGLLPRLRLPLPQAEGVAFADFAARRRGPSDRHYQYMNMREGEFAPLGKTAPIGCIVLLDRRSEGGAELVPVSQGEVLKHAIRKNFATTAPPLRIFRDLLAVTSKARRYRLHYARGQDAVALVEKELG